MAITYPTPEVIADSYLLKLKGLKPSAVTDQTDSEDNDWWIRSRVIGGVASGIYSDQRKVGEDAFPQNARRDALLKWIFAYFNQNSFRPATPANGYAKVTGVNGSLLATGTQFTYSPNGNLYQATEDLTLAGPSGVVPVQSVNVGQSQNLLEGAQLALQSPPAGIDSAAFVYGDDVKDGKNEETEAEASARILARMRAAIRGGTLEDYAQWAFEADPSVSSSNVLRYAFGFGTLAVVITAGTTDIDTAIDNGDPVLLEPSQETIDNVQAYIDSKRPVTACPTVIGATELEVDVTVYVRFAQGGLATVIAGQSLTQEELVKREVMRAIYKTPPGGRQFDGTGYVVASEIEEMIDFNLSASPIAVGEKYELITDRQVGDLALSGTNLEILAFQVAVPGTITVMEL